MKLDLKVINQKCIGSSETTREASVFNLDRVLYQTTPKPSKKVKNKTLFFEWFIGFTEGDGSFISAKFPTKKKPDNKRPIFIISQRHPQVLFTIKKELGFGVIKYVPATEKHAAFFKYIVNSLKHIQWLILLFNGNLRMTKVQKRFALWLEHFNNLRYQLQINPSIKVTAYAETSYIDRLKRKEAVPDLEEFQKAVDPEVLALIPLKPFMEESAAQISFTCAWLAGFVDAEGNFFASLTKHKRFKLGYRDRFKFSIAQKDARWLLMRIGEVIEEASFLKFGDKKGGSTTGYVTSYKNNPGIYRLEISKMNQLKILIEYFDNYSLLSRQRLVFIRWKRVILGKDKYKEAALGSEKAMTRYKRVFASIGKIRDVLSLETQKQIQEETNFSLSLSCKSGASANLLANRRFALARR